MSFIDKIEKDYNSDKISLKELEDLRIKYSELNNEDKLILDQQKEEDAEEDSVIEAIPELSKPSEDSKINSYKVASDGWIIAGFVFAFLGGYLGIAMGANYAFGNYKRGTKSIG